MDGFLDDGLDNQGILHVVDQDQHHQLLGMQYRIMIQLLSVVNVAGEDQTSVVGPGEDSVTDLHISKHSLTSSSLSWLSSSQVFHI